MKKREYLVLDQIIFKKGGWSKSEHNEFLDSFIELVENFNAQAGGGCNLHTEEEIDELFED